MFNKGYSFNLVNEKSFSENDLQTIYHYNFRGKRRYIVLIEEYAGAIFVVKFYPHSYSGSPDKYNVIVSDYDAPRVIRTAIDIMLHIFKGCPDASFGFIASNSITNTYEENKYYNKRFRIYRMLMANFFATETFEHILNEKVSAYLLVNRSNIDIDTFIENAMKMFIRNYPDLEPEL